MKIWKTLKRWLRQLARKDLPSAVVKTEVGKEPIAVALEDVKPGELVAISLPTLPKNELEKRVELEKKKWLPPPSKPVRRITRRRHQGGQQRIKVSKRAFKGPPKTAFEKQQWKKDAKTEEEND